MTLKKVAIENVSNIEDLSVAGSMELFQAVEVLGIKAKYTMAHVNKLMTQSLFIAGCTISKERAISLTVQVAEQNGGAIAKTLGAEWIEVQKQQKALHAKLEAEKKQRATEIAEKSNVFEAYVAYKNKNIDFDTFVKVLFAKTKFDPTKVQIGDTFAKIEKGFVAFTIENIENNMKQVVVTFYKNGAVKYEEEIEIENELFPTEISENKALAIVHGERVSKLSVRNLTEKQQNSLKSLVYWCWEKSTDKAYGVDKAYQIKCDKEIAYCMEHCDTVGVPKIYQDAVILNTTHHTDFTSLREIFPL